MAFSATHFRKSVTEEFSSDLTCKYDPQDCGDEGHNAIPLTVQSKGDGVLRMVQNNFTIEDRAPSSFYRLISCAFPFAGKLPKVSPRGNNWDSRALPTVFAGPSSQPTNLVDMSFCNLSSMVQEFQFYCNSVTTIIMQGIEFGPETDLQLFSSSRQTDLSECFHAAYAVMHACTQYTFMKYELERKILRSKTAFCSIMCGEGVKHWGIDLHTCGDLQGAMAREEGDHYGIAQQADGMDMQTQQFPKGTQAFAHPRVVSAVNDICQEVKEAYEQLICWVHEVRERMKHLCSIVEGPYGSIYRNMRDHALVSQLTRWLKSVKCAFVTFDKLTAIVVDADLTREWGDKVEAQWRELPELIDEFHLRRDVRREVRSLRMPPIQLLMRLKLSYDFNNRVYLRSLLTHADTALFRMHVGKATERAICYHRTPEEGVEIDIEATDNIDPSVKQARYLSVANGFFISPVFNDEWVFDIMNRLELLDLLHLMFSSQVFYMVIAKNNKYWTHLSNMFLIKHRTTIPLAQGDTMRRNIRFRPQTLPRFEGVAFENYYSAFYTLQATLTTRANQGQFFCAYCLAETSFRSSLIYNVAICTACYNKHTVTAIEVRKTKRTDDREWYRQLGFVRSMIPWKLEFRPTSANKLHMDIVFNKNEFVLLMLQMSHLEHALSPTFGGGLDIKDRMEGVHVRHVFGGPHGQLGEPNKVVLCSNFHKYAARQYGVSRVTMRDGHSLDAIRRFMGNYSHPRNARCTYELYGENAKDVRVVKKEPEAVDLSGDDEVTFPYYYKKHVPGQPEVFRVNRPFSVMTADQPAKVCQVVATTSLTCDVPLCELCYARAYALGVDNMMVETDSDEEELGEVVDF